MVTMNAVAADRLRERFDGALDSETAVAEPVDRRSDGDPGADDAGGAGANGSGGSER